LTYFRKPTIAVALVAALTTATVTAAHSSPHDPPSYPPEAGAQIAGHTIEYATYMTQLATYDMLTTIGTYTTWQAAIDAAAAAQAQAEAAAQAAAARARAVPESGPARAAAPPTGGTTGACGGATNGADQYIHRESGGNPNIVNGSSGAYGCYQILPSTWASSCRDINGGTPSGSTPAEQAACASRLPLSAWNL
jgi:hypothetical protein